ncbi:XRE family transcriptional regulator [Moraxella bovoculi]|uniref:XRE family transcriptional regulator n=1 Tax=Moraxella bovoculi TaxID=386891 RepID=UPI00072F4C76|nr:S24 family peptidase [Moraxella bovoculi]ALT07523.1 hypothetical protein AAX08_06430 [Moraxella bovoculi]
MSTLGERLKLARENKKLSQQEVAARAGISQPTYYKIESGKTKRTTYLHELAKVLGVTPEWLATDEGEMMTNQQKVGALVESLPNGITHDDIEPWRKDNQVWVDFYDVTFCCGVGAAQPEFEALKKTLPFDESFFRYRKINPNNFKMIHATGDSMSPYINPHDAVGIDISDIQPKDGEVYALFLDGDLMIKRVFREGGGVLRLASDNTNYRDKIVNHDNGDSLIIIGRVAYRSG